MNVSVDGAFVYFKIPIFGGIPITQTTVSSFVVTLILVIACICLGRNLQKRPSGKQVLVEKGVSMIYNLTVSAMGQHNAHWAPFMGTHSSAKRPSAVEQTAVTNQIIIMAMFWS